MSDPVTYTFYGTTVPVLLNIINSAINALRTAKKEQSNGSLPSDQEILDSAFGDMMPFRMQPLLLAKFSLVAIEALKLSQIKCPALKTEYKTLDEVIDDFVGVLNVLDNIDEQAYNDAAEKSCDVPIAPGKPALHMPGLADYIHGFVIPNSYFHLNVMYTLLRNAGFKLGKGVYINPFMTEQQQQAWAPLRG